MEEQEVDQVIQVEVSNNLATDDLSSTASTTAADDNANNLSNFNVVEKPPSEEEEQGNTQACLEEDEINDMNMNEAASEDSGMSSVDNLSAPHSAGGLAHPGMLVMPTSPISVTTASMSASDDMIENENEMLRDRVADLEKRVHDQNDEITCLRATLADCLRRINSLESNKSHTMVTSSMQPPRLRRDMVDSPSRTPGRRPVSGSYSQDLNGTPGMRTSQQHESINRRASYASNRDKLGSKSSLYQSTSSLHASEQSSPSPAPSPSPTTPGPRHASPGGHRLPGPRPLSASLHKKWSSSQDFSRELSPGPQMLQRRAPSTAGSLASLRSPFGSQQNLAGAGQHSRLRHGTRDAQWSAEEGVLRMHLRGRPINLVCPSSQLEGYSLARVSPAPTAKLRLEWVYGYRGRDARSNLHLLPTGEMVYFVAAVVVLYNVEEQAQRHYLGHTADIKCMSVHPNKLLIATGQTSSALERPHVRIWNSVSLQTVHTLGQADFEHNICCVSFSKADGGNLLVAVEESEHTISVWDWARGDRGHKITETKCSTETVVAAEFHPLEGRTVVTVGKGFVNFWQLDPTSFTLSRKTGIFDARDKPKYVTCLAFSSTGDVITGDSNGNVFIWGRGYNAVTKVMRKVHDGPIFSICVLKDGSIITGGGKDSRIVKFDTLYRKTGMEAQLPEHLGSIRTLSQGRGSQLLLGTTKNSILTGNFDLNFQEIMVGHVSDVWALAASPTQPQFISAGHDRMIHLWDTLTHSVVWSNDVGEQAQSACFSPEGEVLVVGTVTGKWVVLDAATREVFGVHQDGEEPVHCVKFSPDGSLLALGSRDNAIYTYQVKENYRKYNRLGRCLGHSSHVIQLDWTTDCQHIRSNSADHEVMFWSTAVCRPVRDIEVLRDLQWATADCPVSWGSLGVWGETAESPEVGCGARSKDGQLLASGDGLGRVRLHSFPACQPKSLSHTYTGHSGQVSSVSWVSDGSRLLSSGGKDTAILQWAML